MSLCISMWSRIKSLRNYPNWMFYWNRCLSLQTYEETHTLRIYNIIAHMPMLHIYDTNAILFTFICCCLRSLFTCNVTNLISTLAKIHSRVSHRCYAFCYWLWCLHGMDKSSSALLWDSKKVHCHSFEMRRNLYSLPAVKIIGMRLLPLATCFVLFILKRLINA